MNGMFVTFLLYTAYYHSCGAVYFHEPSYIELKPHDFIEKNTSDFGFSLGYQSTWQKLVVGAPHSDLDGKVYSCPMTGVSSKESIECDTIDINIDKLAVGYTRSMYPNQHFCLGSTISTTKDFIFTCAPLVTANLTWNTHWKPGVYGTCFITNTTDTYKYNGMFERYKTYGGVYPPIDYYFSGNGWSTLADEKNQVIFIANRPAYVNSVVQYIHTYAPDEYSNTLNISPQHKYKGRGMAAVDFFVNKNTSYAISAQDFKNHGIVLFMNLNSTLMNSKVITKDSTIGTLFGTTLHAVDITGDNYSELLVGAPTADKESEYEVGAIYIYLGGRKIEDIEMLKIKDGLCIKGSKEGSRFGSSIASADLDEDNHPEIFVGAPYEDQGDGAVYIISGYNLDKMLKKIGSDLTYVYLKDLSGVQRISNTKFKTFGFSLQPVLNINGTDAKPIYLSIGSPGSGRAVLYRSIPSITVDVKVIPKKEVRPKDPEFTVTVTINVTFPSKATVSGDLLISTKVVGDEASILNHAEFDRVALSPTISKEYTVKLANNNPGTYIFNATVSLDEEIYKMKEFTSSVMRISGQSKHTFELPISRYCKDGECVALLSAEIIWSNSNNQYYELGSTETEVVDVVFKNNGDKSYDSCVKIKVSGAKVKDLKQCEQSNDNDWYKCIFNEMDRLQEITITLQLNMDQNTNQDKELRVDVQLFNKCAFEEMTPVQKIIPYKITRSDIHVEGSSYDRKVIDRELENLSEDSDALIDVPETYTIVNNGSVTWKDIKVQISLKAEKYIKEYKVSGTIANNCVKEKNRPDFITYICKLDVKRHSTVEIVTTINILKSKIKNALVNDKLQVSSQLKLQLNTGIKDIESSLYTTVFLEKDTSIGQNKGLMILIFSLAAVGVLILVVVICFWLGFFKRKEKTELDILKKEVHRRESIKRTARVATGEGSTESDTEEKRKSSIESRDNETCARDSIVLHEEEVEEQ